MNWMKKETGKLMVGMKIIEKSERDKEGIKSKRENERTEQRERERKTSDGKRGR